MVSWSATYLPVVVLSLACILRSHTSALPSSNLSDIPIRNLASPRFFGAAANTTFLFNDPVYTKIAQTQFSIFTPENEMKWEVIQPLQGVFNFTPADEIGKSAPALGEHFLDRVRTRPGSPKPYPNSHDSLQKMRGVNEMISDALNISVFKQNIWTQKLGEESLAKALTYAHATDPSVHLYINDYGTEEINNKSDNLYNVVKGLQKDGIPIHGVGFQCHFSLGGVPSTLQANLERFAALGLDVAITELDINLGSFGNETLYEAQAKDYAAVVNACVQVERCVSVSTWGITDNHSWIPGKSVLPWNGEGQPKPAFFAIQDSFAAAKGGH